MECQKVLRQLCFSSFILVIFGVILKINSIYSITVNSQSFGSSFYFVLFSQLMSLIIFIFIIYYAAVGYKKDDIFYKIGIYLNIILLLVVVAINLFAEPIVRLIEVVQLVLLVVFVRNLENINLSKRLIQILVVLAMILLVIFAVDDIHRLDYAITPLIIIGTFGLTYYTRFELKLNR